MVNSLRLSKSITTKAKGCIELCIREKKRINCAFRLPISFSILTSMKGQSLQKHQCGRCLPIAKR